MANVFEINLAPTTFVPDTTSPPGFGVVRHRPYWAFDGASDETIYSSFAQVPESYNGGTVKLDCWYIMSSDVSGTVELEVSVEAVTDGDLLDFDATDSFDTLNTGTETVPATAGYPSKLTVTLTNKDTMAAGDYLRMKITRDADDGVNDTATGDLFFLGCVLREEV